MNSMMDGNILSSQGSKAEILELESNLWLIKIELELQAQERDD